MTRPVAYIRRSAADAGSPGDISREVQEHAIRELAQRDGHNGDLVVYIDWARSADEEKEAKRTQFRAMLNAVEKGDVSTIYAYALDRLHRSVTQTAKLVRACQEHGVRIVTQREGEVRHDSPDEWLRFTTLATFAEYELRVIKKRVEAAFERRNARGDVFGHAPFGYRHVRGEGGKIMRVRDDGADVETVLEAVREAGSILGACRLLERRGVPAPKGGRRWATSALTRIVTREAPELLPRKGPTGRRTPTHALLGQLLRCHCGTVMTPNVTRGQYYCNRGHIEGSTTHGKYNVREVDLLPWVMAETRKYRRPADWVDLVSRNADRRVELQDERERVGVAFTRRAISLEAMETRLAEIDAELNEMEAVDDAELLPDAIAWEDADGHPLPSGEQNGLLRALWDHIQLGPDMRPVEAVWRVPEWRA